MLMKRRSLYKISIEDESRLETVADYSATSLRWIFLGGVAVIAIMTLGVAIAFMTPLKNLLPGYLKESERAATEMQLLRLDSIRTAYETNTTFLNNIRSILNSANQTSNILSSSKVLNTTDSFPLLPKDTLMPTSIEEEKFVAMMREREKYSISVIAPLAAESLMFSPVSDESVFKETSKTALRGEVILAKNSPICAIADGTVIAVSQTIRDGGSTIIIQHAKGFLSRCSRMGTVLVEPGDVVSGRQVIALANRGNGRIAEFITVEMWHNGDPLVPYDYLGDSQNEPLRHPASYNKAIK